MANLDIMEIDETSTNILEIPQTPGFNTRILRKRKSEVNIKSSNRRVSMKPRKHSVMTENASPKQIEALYLNKKVKALSQTLETIYEEPKTDNGNETFIGGRKMKRLITFQTGNRYTKDKIKRQRAKIKKLLGSKSFLNRKKIPMQVFLKKIECLDLDETQSENITDSVS